MNRSSKWFAVFLLFAGRILESGVAGDGLALVAGALFYGGFFTLLFSPSKLES